MAKKILPPTVKLWKINLRTYRVGQGAQAKNYDVKGSMAELLFHPDQKLTVDETFDVKKLADRIRAAGSEVLVDQMDLMRLRRAYQTMRSPAEEDLEFFQRIRDAQEVEGVEKKPGP